MSGSREALAEVGGSIRHWVTVSNVGDADATEVAVDTGIDEEIEPVAAFPPDGVTVTSFGSGPGGDLVWTIDELPAGAEVSLEWAGRVVAVGDMRADVEVEAASEDSVPAETASVVYLGAATAPDVSNPPVVMARQKVLVRVFAGRRTRPAASVEPAGAPMPFTGRPYDLAVVAGLVLVLLGGVVWRAQRVARARVYLLLALLISGACVSDRVQNRESGGSAPIAGTPAPSAEASPSPSPRVKGLRIRRTPGRAKADRNPGTRNQGGTPGQRRTPNDPRGTAGTVTDLPDLVASGSDAPPRFELVERTRVRPIDPDDLASIRLESRSGDNTVTYSWEDSPPELASATSSSLITPGAVARLTSALEQDGSGMHATVTLANTSDDTVVEVDGRIVYEVWEEQGLVARLASDTIRTTLLPGGEVGVGFVYALPTGSYRAESSFQAD